MKLERTIYPATEPVTGQEMADQLNISADYKEDHRDSLIKAAREMVEVDTDLALINQTWTMTLDGWPKKETIHLPKGHVSSITSFSYLNTEGVLTPLTSGTDYIFTSNGKKAELIPVNSWPSVKSDRKEVITVVYVAGFGVACDVPESIKMAIKAKGTDLYEGRDEFMKTYKDFVSFERNIFDYSINDA